MIGRILGSLGFVASVVHEGRYQPAPFDEAVARWTGQARSHTAEQMLRYHYAFREVRQCFERGEDFDITVDGSRPIQSYRKVVRVDDRE